MLSTANIKSNILDFWGEGRTTCNGVSTGFTNSYNVNYQFQVVSPGADDAGKKIPNRIPTQSHANSDIAMYVNSNTFRFVTLMSAPINEKAAQEMIRVVQTDSGMIILYGSIDENSIRCFENQAICCNLFHDKFTSALVDSIEGLESIVLHGHPQCTRVYHKSLPRTQLTVNHTSWCVGQESGSDEGGYSSFVAPEGQVLVGQNHEGDENGTTWYETGYVVLDNGIVSSVCSISLDSSGWISVGCESGKGTAMGHSQFVCPKGSVLMGRKHIGGKHGETLYRYGRITCLGMLCETYDVSDWIYAGKESSAKFTSPDGSVMVGRKHKGDENGDTWYKVARVRLVV